MNTSKNAILASKPLEMEPPQKGHVYEYTPFFRYPFLRAFLPNRVFRSIIFVLLGMTWPGVALASGDPMVLIFWGAILFTVMFVVGGLVAFVTLLFFKKILKKEKSRWLMPVLMMEMIAIAALIGWNIRAVIDGLAAVLSKIT